MKININTKKTLESESFFVLQKFFRLTVYLYKIQMLRYLNYISFDFFFYLDTFAEVNDICI